MANDYIITPLILRYDWEGVNYIAEHAQSLREGMWPDGIPSNYTELPGATSSSRAPFEVAVLTLLELELRVKRCGVDGLLAEQKLMGKTEEEIAKERYLDIEFLERRINKVLWYCASGSMPGWVSTRWRFGMTYEEWKSNRCRFRRKAD